MYFSVQGAASQLAALLEAVNGDFALSDLAGFSALSEEDQESLQQAFDKAPRGPRPPEEPTKRTTETAKASNGKAKPVKGQKKSVPSDSEGESEGEKEEGEEDEDESVEEEEDRPAKKLKTDNVSPEYENLKSRTDNRYA